VISAFTKFAVPLTVNVSPTIVLTVKFLATVSELLIVVVPVEAAKLSAVAAPKAFTVVAEVSNTANVLLFVVTLVLN
jgi:hypothetical protein